MLIMKLKSIIFFCCLFVLLSTSLCCAEMGFKLAWDYDSNIPITGYRLYMSNKTATYDSNSPVQIIRDPNTKLATISGLPNNIYFFVVTAFKDANDVFIESEFSNEVNSFLPQPTIRKCIGINE